MIRTPFCVVFVGGATLPTQLLRRLVSLDLNLHYRKAASGTVTFRDPDSWITDNKIFTKGQRVAFLMGYTHEAVPVGPYIVKGYDLAFPENGDPTISVRFQDLSHKMNKKQKRKRWVGSPTNIIKRIANTHGLGYDIDTIDGLEFTDDFPLIQANLTDASLMQKLSARYGYVWGINGRNLYFKRPGDLVDDRVQDFDQVPVLSYRINDQSLKSFKPKVKFSRNKKKKAADPLESSLDLLKDNVGEVLGGFDLGELGLSADDISPKLAELMKTAPGQEGDDEDESSDVGQSGATEKVAVLDQFKGIMEEVTKVVAGDEEIVESEPGDSSGGATPDNETEAKRRATAKKLGSTEIITATAIPTIPSMRYWPKQAIIAAGVGERFSGQYKVVATKQLYSGANAAFKTELTVERRTFKPDKKSKKKIGDAKGDTESGKLEVKQPGGTGSGSGQPAKNEAWLDVVGGQFTVKKVDGVEQ